MLFVIAMMIEDNNTGAMTLVQDTFVGVTEDEALGKALKSFKGYGLKTKSNLIVHSYKIYFVSNDVSEQEYDLEGIDSQIIDFLHQGHKIQAITRHRQISGYGLKESKEYIDNLCFQHKQWQWLGKIS